MKQQQIKDFVIPARPDILIRLGELIQKGDPGIDEVAELVRADVSLYANTLAMINSPFFGLRRKVTAVNTAVRILGVKRTLRIVEVAALRSTLGNSEEMEPFWQEANLVATVAGQLCRHFGFISRDDAYTLGMMHNCGVPLMVKECPGFNRFYQDHSLMDPYDVMELEKDLFHVNQYRVSAEIVSAWMMPDCIAQAIDLQPYYTTILADNSFDEEVCSLLAVLLLAKEFSLKFATLWGFEDDYQPVLAMDPIQERLGLTSQDLVNIQNAVFNSLRVDDRGIVPR
ncbi:MAG: HDOD domain-containing protein [Marinobacterium sp.]|nr:HDOD domain-containing protein [Marinobacterium sp.]